MVSLDFLQIFQDFLFEDGEIHGSAGPLGAAGAATTALSMAADWSTPLGEHLTQGDPRWGVAAGHCWVVVSIKWLIGVTGDNYGYPLIIL